MDVGANAGLPETWESRRSRLRIIFFEPDDGAFKAREERKAEGEGWFNLGLYSEAGPLDFLVTRASKGQLVFADALYFKDVTSSKLAPAKPLDEIVRAVPACLVYGYIDYALELIDGCTGNLLAPDEARDLEGYVRSHQAPGQRLPNFPGRSALSALALRTHQLLTPRRYRYSQPPLGNRLRTR